MLLCLAITLCVVAWGFLAFAAIDFGRSARGGESESWAYLALACVGAAACLFVAMILVGRLLRATGIISPPVSAPQPRQPLSPATTPTVPESGTRPTSSAQPEPAAAAQLVGPAANTSYADTAQTSATQTSAAQSSATQTSAMQTSAADPLSGDTAEVPKVAPATSATQAGPAYADTSPAHTSYDVTTDPLSGDTAEVPKVPSVRYKGKRIAR